MAISEGWFKTGDLVEKHDESFFRIIGRKKEVINVGGEKVLPGEVEDLVMTIKTGGRLYRFFRFPMG